MEQSVSKSEKGANLILGVFLIALGAFFVLLNFVLMPLVGIILGIPCIGLGIVFLVKHSRRLSGTGRSSEQ
jgi:hypothetical protein